MLASSGYARRASASIGIALFAPGGPVSGEAVLVEADLAMYAAASSYATVRPTRPTSS